MYVCMYVWMYVCMHVCMYACMYVCMHACMYVCMYACMYVCMHVCMYACMYVCMYVCMCMYVYMHIHVFFVDIYIYIYIYVLVIWQLWVLLPPWWGLVILGFQALELILLVPNLAGCIPKFLTQILVGHIHMFATLLVGRLLEVVHVNGAPFPIFASLQPIFKQLLKKNPVLVDLFQKNQTSLNMAMTSSIVILMLQKNTYPFRFLQFIYIYIYKYILYAKLLCFFPTAALSTDCGHRAPGFSRYVIYITPLKR